MARVHFHLLAATLLTAFGCHQDETVGPPDPGGTDTSGPQLDMLFLSNFPHEESLEATAAVEGLIQAVRTHELPRVISAANDVVAVGGQVRAVRELREILCLRSRAFPAEPLPLVQERGQTTTPASDSLADLRESLEDADADEFTSEDAERPENGVPETIEENRSLLKHKRYALLALGYIGPEAVGTLVYAAEGRLSSAARIDPSHLAGDGGVSRWAGQILLDTYPLKSAEQDLRDDVFELKRRHTLRGDLPSPRASVSGLIVILNDEDETSQKRAELAIEYLARVADQDFLQKWTTCLDEVCAPSSRLRIRVKTLLEGDGTEQTP